MNGVDIRDPTADVRVLEFCYSVPDRVFMCPETGLDRWLIREAMRGRLSDVVRLNTRRGRQAADLVPRLRACSDEVSESLDHVSRTAASASASGIIDIDCLREAWSKVLTEDTVEARRLAVSVLTRGLMGALSIDSLY